MTASRSTKEAIRYWKQRHTEEGRDCPFCDVQPNEDRYVEESSTLTVIRNRFPYSIWDGQGVIDHLMITPKIHTNSLNDLSDEGAREFIRLVNKYEADGYNVYARAPASTAKSIYHQHTHLIKVDGKTRRLMFVLQRPFYFRISR